MTVQFPNEKKRDFNERIHCSSWCNIHLCQGEEPPTVQWEGKTMTQSLMGRTKPHIKQAWTRVSPCSPSKPFPSPVSTCCPTCFHVKFSGILRLHSRSCHGNWIHLRFHMLIISISFFSTHIYLKISIVLHGLITTPALPFRTGNWICYLNPGLSHSLS